MLENILNKETRILILEDSYPDAYLMEVELTDASIPYISHRVETRDDFAVALVEFYPDMILADYHLPAFNGLEALALAQKTCPDTPFLIVTGALGEERAVECIRKGAADFLLKDNLHRLPQVVLRTLRESQEKHQRKQAELVRNRLFDILEATTDFVGITDSDGKMVYLNQTWRNLIGIPEDANIDSHKITDLYSPPIGKVLEREAIPKAKNGNIWSKEMQILDGQGEEIPVSQVIIAHKNGAGEVDYFSAIARDITDLKDAEDRAIRAIVRGEDQERQRIAREIHDSLGQTLTAASLNLESIKQDIGQLGGKSQELFHIAFGLINSAIRESREISHNLMPKVIEDFGLILALENLINKIEHATGMEFLFFHNVSNERFDYDIELNLFRITQEAINNIVRHANASRVSIQLIMDEDELIYTIEDDGVGFDTQILKGIDTGIGIMGIKNRVVSIGGKISIESAQNKGTLIAIEVKNLQYVRAK